MKRWWRVSGQDPAAGTHAQTAKAQTRFMRFNSFRLLLMAAGLVLLWFLGGGPGLSPAEELLWEKVRAAQVHLSQWRQRNGTAAPPGSDPWDCGMIGVEWSAITTTLGELASKRTACNPAWSVQFSRWFHELGLGPGDRIAIYSSGSFPGLLLNAIAAAEALQLEPLLIVSLGSSTWGANHPDAPWPVLMTELRRGGFISKRADYYTLGADAELGHGLAPEGAALLRKAATDTGVELLMAANLKEMIARKTAMMDQFQPRALINIGGSQANLGDAEEVLRLSTGLVPGAESGQAGNGVIGHAMRAGVPVIHMLNLKSIGARVGIPYDGPPRKAAPFRGSTGWSLAGVLLFFIILLTHRRWRLEPAEA